MCNGNYWGTFVTFPTDLLAGHGIELQGKKTKSIDTCSFITSWLSLFINEMIKDRVYNATPCFLSLVSNKKNDKAKTKRT